MSLSSFAPIDLHKHLINHYVLTRRGTTALLGRDRSKDKKDFDVIRENHKFLWEEDDEPDTWEKKLAKKYYDKLFKEYCICDLSRFKEKKFQVAMRWQTEAELVSGKGQFICGEKRCTETDALRTWEVNFGYVEAGEKKNSLVKLRLCPECSYKLNYRSKKKELKRISKKRPKKMSSSPGKSSKSEAESSKSPTEETEKLTTDEQTKVNEDSTEESNIWKESANAAEERSRDEDFEEYLAQLLL